MAKKLWTSDEIIVLIENYNPDNIERLIKLLGRSKSAIERKRKYILKCLKPKKTSGFATSIQGKRKDLGDNFFRSSWEANIARWLNYRNISWEFEPKTFYFNKYRRGAQSYTPDFFLPKTKQWIEVKGGLSTVGKTKLKRFKACYKKQFDNLIAICTKQNESFFRSLGVKEILIYNNIEADMYGVIQTWE